MSKSFPLQIASVMIGTLLFGPIALGQEAQPGWRTPDPQRTVYLDTSEGGIVIELAPRFAPQTVSQFVRLVREGFYDGQSFYRVIDGFVAQGGDGSDISGELKQPTLPAEFEWSVDPAGNADSGEKTSDRPPFVLAQEGDMFAAATGFVDGFPAAHDADSSHYWYVHCPAAVAMARDNAPNSGSTDFYIVIGQAPRYLDRNLSIFGRVIYGMDVVQKIQRGPSDRDGIIRDVPLRTRILKASIAADLPAEERLQLHITDTESTEFAQTMDSRRNRTHEFFHHKPPAVLDVCQIPLQSQLLSSENNTEAESE